MKRTVWKYPLTETDLQGIEMPSGAIPLCVQMQHDQPVLYMLVDPTARTVSRQVTIMGTGRLHEIPFTEVYVGTFQMYGGALVFHVFINPG